MLFFFTFFYALLCSIVVYPPAVFISAGLTIAQLFSSILGSEDESFVQYHVRRIAMFAFAHSCLPLGYVYGLIVYGLIDIFDISNVPFLYKLLATASVVLPTVVAMNIFDWSRDGWASHPLCKNLSKFCDDENTTWTALATTINNEFKSVDKICLSVNSIIKTVVTTNWIIHLNSYSGHFVKQSDAIMIVKNSDTQKLSLSNGGEQQFIDIEVRSETSKKVNFCFRLNSLDFKELQSKVTKPIVILPHIVFHKTTIDKFIDVFKEQVTLNGKYRTPEELESCIGCMQTLADVKISRRCNIDIVERDDDRVVPTCQVCGCRPMWCADCMARWFATRQDPNQSDQWLSQKCTCPLCRQVFCIYDVCFVESTAW